MTRSKTLQFNSSVLAQNGDTLIGAMDTALSAHANQMWLEGWTDYSEGSAFWRSHDPAWSFPNQYINIIRDYADPRTVTMRFDAEGADEFYPIGSAGTVFRADGLNVRNLSPSGWAVTGLPAGGWIQFDSVPCSAGNYCFPISYSSTAAHTLQLQVDGAALASVSVPATGGTNTFATAYLGTKALVDGLHSFKVVCVDGGVDLDWLFVKKNDMLMSLQSANCSKYLSANKGGNDLILSATAAGPYEYFTVEDLNAGGWVASGGSVNIQVYNGLYLSSGGANGGTVAGNHRLPGPWESWTIAKTS